MNSASQEAILPLLAALASALPTTCECDRQCLQRRIDRDDWIPADIVRVLELLPARFRAAVRALESTESDG
jgi:hypothetical protein